MLERRNFSSSWCCCFLPTLVIIMVESLNMWVCSCCVYISLHNVDIIIGYLLSVVPRRQLSRVWEAACCFRTILCCEFNTFRYQLIDSNCYKVTIFSLCRTGASAQPGLRGGLLLPCDSTRSVNVVVLVHSVRDRQGLLLLAIGLPRDLSNVVLGHSHSVRCMRGPVYPAQPGLRGGLVLT